MVSKLFLITLVGCQTAVVAKTKDQVKTQPNILFVISDDQAYPFASAYGTNWVKTPNFDRIAREGILFTNAFVTSPGCSPSRASILTGRYPWQLEEAGTHGSSFPIKYKTFTQLLEENGYAVGFTGKPWGPGDWQVSGWKQNPVGKEFNQLKIKPPFSGISAIDYAKNFELFLSQRKNNQRFFFWFGAQEPHRTFEEGSGLKTGKSATEVNVPAFLPDNPLVKKDMLDYAVEIEWFDQQLGKILEKLKSIGELDNTLIVVTSDNGMPFPRAKANCYDAGLHVPLAIRWGNLIPSNQTVSSQISTICLAPTFLEAAGLAAEGMYPMSGTSMLKQLLASKFPGEKSGTEIFAGRERHSSARYENRGYPQRIIRTEKFLYIRNYHPEYWPAGAPMVYLENGQLSGDHQAYLDIDESPTIKFLKENNLKNSEITPYFLAATAKRPAEELYDIQLDPACMKNLAGNACYEKEQKKLAGRLHEMLSNTGDSREIGPNPEIWETYPRLKGEVRKFPKE